MLKISSKNQKHLIGKNKFPISVYFPQSTHKAEKVNQSIQKK